MQYEVLGSMIFRGMFSMLKAEPIADLEYVDTRGFKVARYSYNPNGIAVSALRCNAQSEVVVPYKILGDIPQGVTLQHVRDMLKRNNGIIAVYAEKGAVHSAIAYSGELDLDVIETLCAKIDASTMDRDSQRKRVYSLCHLVSPRYGQISLKDARVLVDRICIDYNVPKNKIEFASDLESDRYDGLCFTLPFDILNIEPAFNVIVTRGGKSMKRDTVVHEMAHLIARYEYANDSAIGHGPAFMAIYFELLVRYVYEVLPQTFQQQNTRLDMMNELVALADRLKVKVDKHCILVEGKWYAPKPAKRGR